MSAGWTLAVFALLATSGLDRAAGQAPLGPPPGRAADLLGDSELFSAVSGGITGRAREGRLTAKSGRVTVEYSPGDRAGAGELTGTLEPSRYLELWQEAERAGIWTLTVSAKATGADLLHHELRVRAGTRSHAVAWTGAAPESPSARVASQIGDRILALAREAATQGPETESHVGIGVRDAGGR